MELVAIHEILIHVETEASRGVGLRDLQVTFILFLLLLQKNMILSCSIILKNN